MKHNPALAPQLKATEALIAHSTAAFHQRLGRAMPPRTTSAAQRRAEHAALTRLLAATMADHPAEQ